MKRITAFHLQEWARRTTAKVQFPELVADLIRATATDIGALRFPGGEKGYIRGFDGVLQTSTATGPFVPKNESFWEFGLDANYVAPCLQLKLGIAKWNVTIVWRGDMRFILWIAARRWSNYGNHV